MENDLSRHIVMIESSRERGAGILISTNEPFLGKIYLVVSLSTFTKGFDILKALEQVDFNDSLVTVSQHFKKLEKGFFNR
ncbi:MAG: hypothetical protein IPP37_13520 [Saprospiraceae bacterium]|nr:hypothetical protein [Saprospiraceae bacterium]